MKKKEAILIGVDHATNPALSKVLTYLSICESKDVSFAQCLAKLEEENERLRKMYTQLSIDHQVLKESLQEGWY